MGTAKHPSEKWSEFTTHAVTEGEVSVDVRLRRDASRLTQGDKCHALAALLNCLKGVVSTVGDIGKVAHTARIRRVRTLGLGRPKGVPSNGNGCSGT